jgi:hypothetical protein
MELTSPDRLIRSACDAMLKGADPTTYEDWFKIFNFMAANIDPKAQPAALLLISKIYDTPLGDQEIRAISSLYTSGR